MICHLTTIPLFAHYFPIILSSSICISYLLLHNRLSEVQWLKVTGTNNCHNLMIFWEKKNRVLSRQLEMDTGFEFMGSFPSSDKRALGSYQQKNFFLEFLLKEAPQSVQLGGGSGAWTASLLMPPPNCWPGLQPFQGSAVEDLLLSSCMWLSAGLSLTLWASPQAASVSPHGTCPSFLQGSLLVWLFPE